MKNRFLFLLPLLLCSCASPNASSSEASSAQSSVATSSSEVISSSQEQESSPAASSSEVSSVQNLDFKDAKFVDVTVTYDGQAHILGEVTGIPEGTRVVYSGREEKTDAGVYKATATLSKDGYNTLTLSATLTIEAVTFTGIAFKDLTVDYDGGAKEIVCENVPDFATVTYKDNTGTDVGEYKATATVSAANYKDLVLQATLTIAPVELKGVIFNDQTVPYDGYTHTLTCKNLPEGAMVKYESNSGKDVGTYQAKAVITSKNYKELTLTATLTINEFDPEVDLGTKPIFSSNRLNVTYGLYPQSHVEDEGIIAELNKLGRADIGSNHWFKLGNCYYAKATASPCKVNDSFLFDDGTTMEAGETYWFRCEPIVWDVLSEKDDECFLFSTFGIDGQIYDHHTKAYDGKGDEYIMPCIYYYSDLRSWLNDAFYKSAFALHDYNVLFTEVDNSYESTDAKNVWNYSPNTEDKVFLPSYRELRTYEYGFTTDSNPTFTREKTCTDYARAMGAFFYRGNTAYWTRSPMSESRVGVWLGDVDGRISHEECYYINSVCPCITLLPD